MALAWTDKQRAIYDLLKQGMSFSQVIEQGYAKATVSAVLQAFKKGEAPPEIVAPARVVKTGGSTSLAAIKVPATGVTQFQVGQQIIALYPEDLLICYDHFRDMQAQLGWQSDFSSTFREGVKVLRSILDNFTPKEDSNGPGDERNAG